MKALLFGAHGQVGDAVQETKPPNAELVALGSSDCDIRDQQSVLDAVLTHQPNLLINAAAYTAVDRAESEPELAAAVNTQGAANIARASVAQQCRLIHLSTDFVFDGAATAPIKPEMETNPVSVYGSSKRDGERALLDISADRSVVLRTSWVYSRSGSNFVKTMLRLMAEKDELAIVADQLGSPTWAGGLANVIWAFGDRATLHGIFHWSDAGEISWYDFAVAIQELAYERNLLSQKIPIRPIETTDYPTPARRPQYSVLDCTSSFAATGCRPAPWKTNLERMLTELKS